MRIGIYENLSADFGEKWNIVPFEAGYRKMLSKAKVWIVFQKQKKDRIGI